MIVPKTHQINIGDCFGRWVVIGERHLTPHGKDGRRASAYNCRCTCPLGTERSIKAGSLLRRTSTSCGRCPAHGHSRERLYTLWIGMRARCQNPRRASYRDYGGRGIFVCPEWQHFLVFRAWALANGYTDSLSLDRIDNNQGYCPDNCRWTTSTVQTRNRRNTIFLTAFGETKCLKDWSRDLRCAVIYSGLVKRVHQGWDAEAAIASPATKGSFQPQKEAPARR